jgi:hypothetical protein
MAIPTCQDAHDPVGCSSLLRACKLHAGARLQGLPSNWQSVPALDHQLWQRHHSIKFGLPEEDEAASVPEELSCSISSVPAELAQLQTGRSRPAPETSAWHLNVTSELSATISPLLCVLLWSVCFIWCGVPMYLIRMSRAESALQSNAAGAHAGADNGDYNDVGPRFPGKGDCMPLQPNTAGRMMTPLETARLCADLAMTHALQAAADGCVNGAAHGTRQRHAASANQSVWPRREHRTAQVDGCRISSCTDIAMVHPPQRETDQDEVRHATAGTCNDASEDNRGERRWQGCCHSESLPGLLLKSYVL